MCCFLILTWLTLQFIHAELWCSYTRVWYLLCCVYYFHMFHSHGLCLLRRVQIQCTPQIIDVLLLHSHIGLCWMRPYLVLLSMGQRKFFHLLCILYQFFWTDCGQCRICEQTAPHGKRFWFSSIAQSVEQSLCHGMLRVQSKFFAELLTPAVGIRKDSGQLCNCGLLQLQLSSWPMQRSAHSGSQEPQLHIAFWATVLLGFSK